MTDPHGDMTATIDVGAGLNVTTRLLNRRWLPRIQSICPLGGSDLNVILRFLTQTLLNGYDGYRAITINNLNLNLNPNPNPNQRPGPALATLPGPYTHPSPARCPKSPLCRHHKEMLLDLRR